MSLLERFRDNSHDLRNGLWPHDRGLHVMALEAYEGGPKDALFDGIIFPHVDRIDI